MVSHYSGSIKNNTWLPALLCILPILIYIWFFESIALNVNYVAFDDILILGIIPEFDHAGWAEKWKLLTTLFPEHRLVFSRSVILLIHYLFGTVNLVWPMIVANICWVICAWIFYRAFRRLQLSLWYFVPVMWLWFNVQSFENIFWGVSSLCNFGVILFVTAACFFAAFKPDRPVPALLFALAATFTYGNGIMAFAVVGLLYLLTARYRYVLITVAMAIVVAIIYFSDFTPITQSLDLRDPAEVKAGVGGFLGFIGSIATLSAYAVPLQLLYIAVGTGVFFLFSALLIYRKQFLPLLHAALGKSRYDNPTSLFALAIFTFITITALALAYKRIPTDTFEGMFKGRYRMYSVWWCIALYLGFLSVEKKQWIARIPKWAIPAAILLNLVILHANFAEAVNNRRAAIVQEFNARYNADWLGIRMFSMDQKHFEKIRSYYHSEDPLAENWSPRANTSIPCDSIAEPDDLRQSGDYLLVHFYNDFNGKSSDYSDGAYVILKSPTHIYASAPNQPKVPIKTTLRRGMYFAKGVYASFHTANVEPGLYQVYVLVRKNGRNKIYCTGQTWHEKQ